MCMKQTIISAQLYLFACHFLFFLLFASLVEPHCSMRSCAPVASSCPSWRAFSYWFSVSIDSHRDKAADGLRVSHLGRSRCFAGLAVSKLNDSQTQRHIKQTRARMQILHLADCNKRFHLFFPLLFPLGILTLTALTPGRSADAGCLRENMAIIILITWEHNLLTVCATVYLHVPQLACYYDRDPIILPITATFVCHSFHVILLFFCLSSHLCPDLHPYLTLQTQTEEEEEEAGVIKREKRGCWDRCLDRWRADASSTELSRLPHMYDITCPGCRCHLMRVKLFFLL